MATAPNDRETVKALFGAALELKSEERPAFLLRMSIDPGVRAQVEKLLSEHEQAEDEHFLSSSALGLFGPKVEPQTQRFDIGQLLAGRFKVIRFIAAGGMGEVYEAEDLELRELVAIKTILPDILLNANGVSRFKREVQLARRVTHPNVCRIFDVFRHRPEGTDPELEILIVSMELLHGITLADRLRQDGRIPTDEGIRLIRQLAAALAAAHQHRITHRDFKPGNVMLVPSSKAPDACRAVVTDFGLAIRSIDPASTTVSRATTLATEHGLVGTPAYMAPEQLEGHLATPASDVYSLGVVAYEIVTGVHPNPEKNIVLLINAILNRPPEPPSIRNSQVSRALDSLIVKALDKNPRNRHESADEFLKELERIDRPSLLPETSTRCAIQSSAPAREEESSDVHGHPGLLPKDGAVASPIRPTKPWHKRRWRTLLALATLLLVIGIGLRYWKPTASSSTQHNMVDQERTTLNYYIVAQEFQHGQPYGEPFRLSENGVYKAGSRIRLVFSSPQTRYLYLLNEGPTSTKQLPEFNILFPSPSTNGGMARLAPGTELQIPEGGYFLFDQKRGTERLWLVWSKEALPEFEALKKWSNLKDRGKIGDVAQLRQLKSFLAKSSSTSLNRDDHTGTTTLSGSGDILVHAVELDHE
jgi:serine/threonine protein kinase